MIRPTVKELQRQVREEAILDAARELIGEQGYADMSMDELAARVGISKATLYQHFPSKEELAIHMVVRMMRMGEETWRTMNPDAPAIDRIEQALQRGLERRIGLWATGMNMMPMNVIRHPLYVEQDRRLHQLFMEHIDQGKREGDIRPELSSPVLARTISRLFRSDYDELIADGQSTREDVVATLVAVLINGMRTRSRSS